MDYIILVVYLIVIHCFFFKYVIKNEKQYRSLYKDYLYLKKQKLELELDYNELHQKYKKHFSRRSRDEN
ncbi:MAG: hypothetical protein B6I28_06475 [Fusobacteriia bacterium 4572_132]|nr:MAG: hypothetical protein B6I28_06475 [Fusobacteriia bacterium 4572_132]